MVGETSAWEGWELNVSELQDLVRLLVEHPQWREEMRRLLLSEELLALPELVAKLAAEVRTLAEAQKRTEEQLQSLTKRVDALAEAQKRTEEQLQSLTKRVDALAEAQKRTEEEITRLNSSLASLEISLRAEINKLADKVDDLRGFRREMEFRTKAHGLLGGKLRRIYVYSPNELAHLLANALDQGLIDEEEYRDILLTDAVLKGKEKATEDEVHVAVEVSVTVDIDDVERALKRAQALSKVWPKSLPAVAGERITAGALSLAQRQRVIQITDGKVQWP